MSFHPHQLVDGTSILMVFCNSVRCYFPYTYKSPRTGVGVICDHVFPGSVRQQLQSIDLQVPPLPLLRPVPELPSLGENVAWDVSGGKRLSQMLMDPHMQGSDPHMEGSGPSNPYGFEGPRPVWSEKRLCSWMIIVARWRECFLTTSGRSS